MFAFLFTSFTINLLFGISTVKASDILPDGTLSYMLCQTLNLPQSLDKIPPEFRLYTRSNPKIFYLLDPYSDNNLLKAGFNPDDTTVFIFHGFLGDPDLVGYFVNRMKDAFLNLGSFNVIIMKNTKALRTLNYFQAVANNKVTATITLHLVHRLIKLGLTKPSLIHMIGHSLGAHHAAYVAQIVPGIGRITGLDPAGPCFEGRPENDRLDKNDATFVDNIHTSDISILIGGFGFDKPLGHVDFYPNGGKSMPGCVKGSAVKNNKGHVDLINTVFTRFGCSHFKSPEYFIDSLNPTCQWKAYQCVKSKKLFSFLEKPKCNVCGPKGCNSLGFFANPNKDLGSLFLTTRPCTTPVGPDYNIKFVTKSPTYEEVIVVNTITEQPTYYYETVTEIIEDKS